MSQYQIKRCPHCNCVYEKHSYSFNTTKESRTKYGSPLVRCSHCREYFIDDEYREIVIDGPKPDDAAFLSVGAIVTMMVGLMVCVFYLFTENVKGAIISIVVAFLLGPLPDILSYSKRMNMLKAAKAASKRRLKNVEYAKTLKALGYNVPKKYLDSDSKD